MLFSDGVFTILVWVAMMLISLLTSDWLARSDSPADLFAAKDIFGCAKLICLVSVQIIILLILVLNWCNAAALTLVGFVLVFVDSFIEEKNLSDHIWPIITIPAISLAAGVLIMTYTQSYTPASKQVESHKIISYQIKDSYEYGEHQHRLRHNYAIAYLCEDPSHSGEINLNSQATPSVRFCVDTDNPRIEEITYTQEHIEHVITGGTISFGPEETFKEIVFYLPDTDFLTTPPPLPDE